MRELNSWCVSQANQGNKEIVLSHAKEVDNDKGKRRERTTLGQSNRKERLAFTRTLLLALTPLVVQAAATHPRVPPFHPLLQLPVELGAPFRLLRSQPLSPHRESQDLLRQEKSSLVCNETLVGTTSWEPAGHDLRRAEFLQRRKGVQPIPVEDANVVAVESKFET